MSSNAFETVILLQPPDSFKTIEGPISSIGAFRDDSISVGWCSRVLAIKTRPVIRDKIRAAGTSIIHPKKMIFINKEPDLSFISLALHRSIRYAPLACLQSRVYIEARGNIQEQDSRGGNDSYPYSASLPLRQVVQNNCSS